MSKERNIETVTPSAGGCVFLKGVPDAGLDGLMAHSDGQSLVYVAAGTAAFLGHMPDDIRGWDHVYLPVTRAAKLRLPRKPLVNHMGDADYYGEALAQAINIVETTGAPCFNAPRAIAALRRDRLPELLAGLDGVTVPRCIKTRPRNFEDLAAAVLSNGLTYPVIARLPATHGGKSQTLVEDEGRWSNLNSIPWGGRELYVTQFHDYRDPDGFYRKQRVAVVGDRILPRHGAAGRQWSVDAVVTLPELLEEELNWALEFDEKVLPLIEERVKKIGDRIGLDYFGIDYSLRPNGDMLIFEVSASMSMTVPYTSATHGPIAHCPLAIRQALADLLRRPEAWRCRRMGKPTADQA